MSGEEARVPVPVPVSGHCGTGLRHCPPKATSVSPVSQVLPASHCHSPEDRKIAFSLWIWQRLVDRRQGDAWNELHLCSRGRWQGSGGRPRGFPASAWPGGGESGQRENNEKSFFSCNNHADSISLEWRYRTEIHLSSFFLIPRVVKFLLGVVPSLLSLQLTDT